MFLKMLKFFIYLPIVLLIVYVAWIVGISLLVFLITFFS
jgi:hypothetical protein